VPTLLEVQHALRLSLIGRDSGDAAAMLAARVPADRLDIYRNTFVSGVTKALRLTYPAVHRLVGDTFFAAAAEIFIASNPPRAAYLDQYGAEFPQFLQQLPSAAALAYLADVARLEWAVSQAIHAPDCAPLELSKLTTLADHDRARVSFLPHPSLGLLHLRHPADHIWRAVLGGDDVALAALDLDGPPIHVLVERLPTGVEVMRLDEAGWRFAVALCAGQPLQAALDAAGDVDAGAALASHLAAGRFVDFTLTADKAA
jgi:hypothetical protein